MATLTIPDFLYDKYTAWATELGQPLPLLVADALTRVAEAPRGRRSITLGESHLEAIEPRLGLGQVQSPDDLVKKLGRLASIDFEGVHLQFTPGQLGELKARADREHKTMERYIGEVVALLMDQLLNSAGAGRPLAIPPPTTEAILPPTRPAHLATGEGAGDVRAAAEVE